VFSIQATANGFAIFFTPEKVKLQYILMPNTNLTSPTTPSGTLKITWLALRKTGDFIFSFGWCTSLSRYQVFPHHHRD